jgi:hypothetical protein
MWWAQLLNSVVAFLEGGAGGGGGSYESIATATGTGSSGTITFSSIPSTYSHLQVRVLSKGTATGVAAYPAIIRLNGSSSAIYSEHFLTGNGATASASAGNSPSTTSTTLWKISASSKTSAPNMTNTMGVAIIDIHDYASTTKNKTIRYFGGTECNDTGTNASYVTLGSGLYGATTAVSSLSIITDGGTNFTTSSVFSLYGIKGA